MARKSGLVHHIFTGLYIAFIIAYLCGASVFARQYSNYWACCGFSIVIVLIAIRLALHVLSEESLYKIFPAMSLTRAAFQGFFLCLGLAMLGIGFWLMYRGLHFYQHWDGESYFCSMIGVWMAAKWSFFLNNAMYKFRPDTIEASVMELFSPRESIANNSQEGLLAGEESLELAGTPQ